MSFVRFLVRFSFIAVRMIIIGSLTLYFLSQTSNLWMKSSYGQMNLVLIAILFSTLPLFFILLIEMILYGWRKEKKNRIKESSFYKTNQKTL
jgi:hypothetical protein